MRFFHIFLLAIGLFILFPILILSVLTYAPDLPGAKRTLQYTRTSLGSTSAIPYTTDSFNLTKDYVDHPVLHYIEHLTVSPDGTRAAFATALTGAPSYVLVDKLKFGPFSDIGQLRFSKDSTQLSVLTGTATEGTTVSGSSTASQYYIKYRDDARLFDSSQLQGRQRAHIDSEPITNGAGGELSTMIEPPAVYRLTANITARVEVVRPGCLDENPCLPAQYRVVVEKDGSTYQHRKVTSDKGWGTRWPGRPVLSNDNSRIAYVVGRTAPKGEDYIPYGAAVMVSDLDGSELTHGEDYDEVVSGTLRFSDDNRHIGYAAHRAGIIYWVVEAVE